MCFNWSGECLQLMTLAECKCHKQPTQLYSITTCFKAGLLVIAIRLKSFLLPVINKNNNNNNNSNESKNNNFSNSKNTKFWHGHIWHKVQRLLPNINASWTMLKYVNSLVTQVERHPLFIKAIQDQSLNTTDWRDVWMGVSIYLKKRKEK